MRRPGKLLSVDNILEDIASYVRDLNEYIDYLEEKIERLQRMDLTGGRNAKTE